MPRRPPGRPAQDPPSREAELEALLAEARAQQDATAEILRALRDSPADLAAVMERIAEVAARLSDADSAAIQRIEGEHLRRLANFRSPYALRHAERVEAKLRAQGLGPPYALPPALPGTRA